MWLLIAASRVTTHLEKSGNWKVVTEKSGKLEKVRKSYNHHLAGARVAKILVRVENENQ